MIEILLIRALVKAIGRLLRDKGRSPGLFQFLAVVLWIGGEVTGGVVGVVLELGNGAYVLALLGAASGAGLSWVIAKAAKPTMPIAEVGRVFG
jgi:hypothetical protein